MALYIGILLFTAGPWKRDTFCEKKIMILEVTETAWQKIEEKLADSGHNSLLIRLSSKGCGGSSYVYEPTSDQPKETDKVVSGEKCQVIVDSEAAIFIIGSTLDWVVRDPFNQGFDIVNNSHETGRCGCGESVILQ